MDIANHPRAAHRGCTPLRAYSLTIRSLENPPELRFRLKSEGDHYSNIKGDNSLVKFVFNFNQGEGGVSGNTLVHIAGQADETPHPPPPPHRYSLPKYTSGPSRVQQRYLSHQTIHTYSSFTMSDHFVIVNTEYHWYGC